MSTNRVTLSFIVVPVMAYCIALGGFASPAAARPIVVTTLADTADPPFNADGDCGTGAISDLPGADGLVSLREAIIAANNTPGTQTITFAPNLSGGTIMVGFNGLPLPALCGGHTRINGDIDNDGIPDITLEGSAFPFFTRAAGILVISSRFLDQAERDQRRSGAAPTSRPPKIHRSLTENSPFAYDLAHPCS